MGSGNNTGGASAPTVRAVDDMLMGGQHEAVSYETSHRPADADAICAFHCLLQERFPEEATAGWTSDFAKAFKQVPHLPCLTRLCIIVQWCPKDCRSHFWLPRSQIFGGRSAPQSLSRYPAWFCCLLSSAAAVPIHHCVDDMMGMERVSDVQSSWGTWRSLASLLGWEVHATTSPPPVTILSCGRVSGYTYWYSHT